MRPRNLFTTIALIAVIGFLMAGCDNGTKPGGNNGDLVKPSDDNSGNNNPTNPSGSEGSLYAKAPPVLASDTPVNLSGTAGISIIDKVFNYVNANPGTYTFILNSDVNVGSGDIGSSGLYRALKQPNVNLTITGLGAERKISLTSTGPLFIIGDAAATVQTNISLTLDNNITLVGYRNNNLSAVIVTGGATFTMKGNTVITGNTGGSGVYVNGTGPGGTKFIMQDNASVYGNSNTTGGGGVRVDEYCTFTMRDNASVYGNTAGGLNSSGEGGGVWVRGTFDMYGGTVHGNTAITRGNVPGMGGGVYVYRGAFNMYGGTVYGSDASAALANSAVPGAALFISSSTSSPSLAKYGDGLDILPHTDNQSYRTNNTITGRQ